MRPSRTRVPGWGLFYGNSQGQYRKRGPPFGADPPGPLRQFGYVLSLFVSYCDHARRVYNRAGPWAFGFGIRLSLLSLCLLVTLGRLSPFVIECREMYALSSCLGFRPMCIFRLSWVQSYALITQLS